MRLEYLQIQGFTKDFSTNLYTDNSKHNFTIMKNFIKKLIPNIQKTFGIIDYLVYK